MRHHPPGSQPEQPEPEHSKSAFPQYNGQPPRQPEHGINPAEIVPELPTMPTPAVGRSLPAPARPSQNDVSGKRPDAAPTIDERNTQVLPSIPASPPPMSPASSSPTPPVRRRSSSHARRRKRTAAHRSRFHVPPWVVRVALLVGLVALAVRAANASATFMEPGGYILGWSQLPSAHCVLCHLPQPTRKPGDQPITPEEYASLILPQMTLDEKLGQMMIVQFTGLQPTPDAVQMINAQGAGGVIFFAANIGSANQIESLNEQLKHLSSIPLLTAVDQEGGTVNRLLNIVGPLPSASSLADPTAAETRGELDANLLSMYGFNLNLAPVVDVGTANPQLLDRTFGSDPTQVALLAGAYLEGLQQSGKVTGTLKHFPGLGDTTTDPHIGLPILSRSKADWESIDLAPYRALLKSNDVRSILVTHELIPAVDPNLPASLSPTLINGVLRGELGYNRVVITDSLYMGALNTRWSVPQAAVLAIKAGADMVIGPSDPQMVQQVKDEIKQAMNNGTLTQTMINTAVRRILVLKIEMGLIPLPK